jgi:hypothetical protein
MDGTGLSCKIGFQKIPDTNLLMLTGVETPVDVPYFLDIKYDTSYGTHYDALYKGEHVVVINGFQSLRILRKQKKVKPVKEYLIIMIIPFIEFPFAYAMCCAVSQKWTLMQKLSKKFSIS